MKNFHYNKNKIDKITSVATVILFILILSVFIFGIIPFIIYIIIKIINYVFNLNLELSYIKSVVLGIGLIILKSLYK